MDYDGLSSPESAESLPVLESSEPQLDRFVILWHALSPKNATSTKGSCSVSRSLDPETRFSHFDLMLEKDGHLITFELQQLPIPGEKLVVRPLADHRLVYLDYEGPISGDRGHVTQWTSGRYTTVAETDEKWILELQSPRLSARIVLIRPRKSEPSVGSIKIEPVTLDTGFDYANICPITPEASSYDSGKVAFSLGKPLEVSHWHLRASRWQVTAIPKDGSVD